MFFSAFCLQWSILCWFREIFPLGSTIPENASIISGILNIYSKKIKSAWVVEQVCQVSQVEQLTKYSCTKAPISRGVKVQFLELGKHRCSHTSRMTYSIEFNNRKCFFNQFLGLQYYCLLEEIRKPFIKNFFHC